MTGNRPQLQKMLSLQFGFWITLSRELCGCQERRRIFRVLRWE